MFRKEAIAQLVTLLERRGVSLFHACQYTDFCAYLKLGGVPSRALLETVGETFTAFETDGHDRHNGVWDKVFVNLCDFGRTFAIGQQAVPNPYGPILLQLHPSALLDTQDVAVCYRSAGAADFRRDQEAIRTIAEVDALFYNPTAAGFPYSTYLKSTRLLRQSQPRATAPEVNCSTKTGFLSLMHLIVVWTDPYILACQPLDVWTRAAMEREGQRRPVHKRTSSRCRNALYGELLSALLAGCDNLATLRRHSPNPELVTWADGVEKRGLDYQFRRYARYLLQGTVAPLVETCIDVSC